MEIRVATLNDWDKLYDYYKRVYRPNHPLQNKAFWNWQYGNITYGRSIICLHNDSVVGHVGAAFGGGVAWIINVYLDPEFRGQGALASMYRIARDYMPLAATAANDAGLGLYRNMRWIRYYDIMRFVKINPRLKANNIFDVCNNIDINVSQYHYTDTHYFKQPGLTGIKIDNFTGVNQSEVGGLRLVDFENISKVEDKAWELGYNWVDYITSWNNLQIKDLEKNGWVPDKLSIVPWRLNPLEPGKFCDITFLSEKPLDNDFIVHRSYSDHGRIGSIIV